MAKRIFGRMLVQMYRAEDGDPPAIEDLHAMLKKHGDWMPLGSADEQKPAAEGTVEAWGRSPKNPVKVGCRPFWRRWASLKSHTTRRRTE